MDDGKKKRVWLQKELVLLKGRLATDVRRKTGRTQRWVSSSRSLTKREGNVRSQVQSSRL